MLTSAAIFGLLLAYFTLAWHYVGRDPQPRAVVPLFHPPKGISPVVAGFIHHGGFGSRFSGFDAFAVAITALASKGLVTLEKGMDHYFTIRRTEAAAAKDLPTSERTLLESLLPASGDTLTISETYDPNIERTLNALRNAVAEEVKRVYFRENRLHWHVGLGLAIVTAFTTVIPDIRAASTTAPLAFIAIFAFPLVAALYGFMASDRVWAEVKTIAQVVVVAWLLFALSGLLVEPAATISIFEAPSYAGAAIALGAIAAAIAFRIWLKAPTQLGTRAKAAVEGYKLYLTQAETLRLDRDGDRQPITEALHERHLPYAMALDAEQAWSDKFLSQLLPAAFKVPHMAREFPLGWFRDQGAGPPATSLSHSLTMMVAAAATAPPPETSGDIPVRRDGAPI